MSSQSLYRFLRPLKQAGIVLLSSTRPNIVGFLKEGLESDDDRTEWIRMVIYVVRVRDVRIPGAYIKKLADEHVHMPLTPAELELYKRSREERQRS